jgi:predicted metal-dependent phosphoesterase TrpH
VIDLHLHTTASDGRCTPQELVARAVEAGLTVMAATDHDTTDAVVGLIEDAAARGIQAIPGIEITAVEQGVDLHVLGYFLDPGDETLQRFLAEQREHRVARADAIARRLAQLGHPIDIEPILDEARRHRAHAIGRPQVARAMVDAGVVTSVQDAFDYWLGRGRPAFVPRQGASPEAVIGIIHAAKGLASLAHPGRSDVDDRIPSLRDGGLDAIEVFHSDHDPAEAERYAALARKLGLLVTGGSDFHGDPARGARPGTASLPPDDWSRLEAARGRHA